MNIETAFSPRAQDPQLNGVIKLAVMAVGGQGGGVLTGWIESLARAEGYACQATSVAGVAQRTGATIYYIEMAPKGDAQPVFSLAPSAGDIDVLIAAEMMEAGRAIMRGFVTPDKTTLIASSHRALAVSEKMTPGDGIADADQVIAAAEIAADRLICFDMEALALENGSVISATLFGALAGSSCLPFEKSAYETAIQKGGKGVASSLKAFDAAYLASQHSPKVSSSETESRVEKPPRPSGPPKHLAKWEALRAQIADLPKPAQDIAHAGLCKVVEFMDLDYGHTYLERLQDVAKQDSTEHDFLLTEAAAKYIANAMAYDDVIRVADLKTRQDRTARINVEMSVTDQNLMHITEFLHPRAEEIVGMLPTRMGMRMSANPRSMQRLDRWFGKGHRLRSDRVPSFMTLYFLGGLKRYRRRTYRHAIEQDHLNAWLALALEHTQKDYALGVEILKCRRLIKGYSDTHSRGLSKFDKVLGCLDQLSGRADAADWLARLREAALQDEEGKALDGAIKTVESFT